MASKRLHQYRTSPLWIVALVALAGCARDGVCSRLLETYSWRVPARGVETATEAVAHTLGPESEACVAAQNPWQGPGTCGPGAVLQPDRSQCGVFDDLSPNFHPLTGMYIGQADEGNWLRVAGGPTLELLSAYVIDNGEGDEQPHGPHGNLYWDVFGAFEPLMQSADGADQRWLQAPRVLRGPHRTHGTTDEWLDDESVMYSGAGLFRWNSAPGTADAVVIRVWESDNSEDGFLGRRNDVLGMEHVRRKDTESPCGVWVPFHAYNNDHPRRRGSGIAVWLLLRTRPAQPAGTPLARILEQRS